MVTLGELAAGVHRAVELFGVESPQARARRRTLDAVQPHGRPPFEMFDLDQETWERFGEIRMPLGRRVSHNDTWIAASALVHDRLLVTQDADLAARMGGLPGARVAYVPRAHS